MIGTKKAGKSSNDEVVLEITCNTKYTSYIITLRTQLTANS